MIAPPHGNNYNSTSPPSTIRVSLTFTTTLTAGRARYVTGDYAGAREYITGIDDDDEWTPNRLSVFLAHKQQLVTHAFLYANDYVCRGEVYSQPASLPLYPKSPYSRRLFYKRNIIGNQVFTGVAFQRVLVRYRTESGTGLRHLPADGGGVRRTVESGRGDADPAYQSRRNADHLVTEKILRILPLLPQAQRQIRPRQQKYQLFTLYQIRNKRMTGALC